MSTFLQLCQETCRECGIASGDAVPLAVTGQVGELDRIVNWVANSWTDIQNRHENWRWMRVGFTLATSAADDTYAYTDCIDDITGIAIARFSKWHVDDPYDPPKIYLTASGVSVEGWMTYWDWRAFKRIYKIGAQNDAEPSVITIDPQDNLVLGSQPDAAYTVSGDFQRGPQILAANGDIPDMPTKFHKLIVYEAMKHYALYESAQEVLTKADYYSKRLMRQLEAEQLPTPILGSPMA